ncbi:MAG: DNA polymerase IV [Myxococcota bacterium]|nr:DNA polymerase IV [Myxococcota bacterium]
MLLYAEVPCFYAEIERRDDPALADRPVVVGGDPRKRGTVQAATPDALAAGVCVGMSMIEALERCPRARAVRTDVKRYRDVTAELRACFRRETDRVEAAGPGAAWLDVGDAGEPAEEVAARLRARVAEELRLPLRVGIAPVKFVARLAAEEAGSDGVRRVAAAELPRFLAPLPVERLPGVGPRTLARLHARGLRRVGELAALAPREVEEALGNHGLAIHDYARGRDAGGVRAAPRRRSLSQEVTLPRPELDLAALDERIQELAQGLETALARERQAARRVTLKLRYEDREAVTRTRSLSRAVGTTAALMGVARDLLGRTQAGTRPVRLVGLTVGQLVRARRDERQLDLFR